MNKYANLLHIVRAGIAAERADPEHDLVRGLLAYAAAIDIVEVRAGGIDCGEPDAHDIADAETDGHAFWHPSNTEETLGHAERFAEGWYKNA